MKTRYEMEKLFSVEKDFDGGIKVIAGDVTKTYKGLSVQTVAFLFGMSEYVARSAELFEKYVKPEREAEFSDRMLTMVNCTEKTTADFSPAAHRIQVGGAGGVMRTSVEVNISRIEFEFALAMKDSGKTFDTIINDIAVKKLIDVIK